jgi:hypothetical protein
MSARVAPEPTPRDVDRSPDSVEYRVHGDEELYFSERSGPLS